MLLLFSIFFAKGERIHNSSTTGTVFDISYYYWLTRRIAHSYHL